MASGRLPAGVALTFVAPAFSSRAGPSREGCNAARGSSAHGVKEHLIKPKQGGCVMSKGKIVGIMLAAAALCSPVYAQGTLAQKTVSLAMGEAIANAAISQCRTMGYKISVTVLDRSGLQVIMVHDDGAGLNTREGSDRKAYTAVAFGQPSAAFVKRMQDRPETAGSIHYSRVLALGGGLPIKVGDDVIGAVGVSGTPGKDDVCAKAGIDKVADELK
jgi:uncharacterized protein GlcG (DUF336 family)